MKKKSNQNTWGFFIILFLLFQLGKYGHLNGWFTQKTKSNFEVHECLKKNKGKDISSCNEVPPYFFKLVDKIKKLEDKNLEDKNLENKRLLKKE